MHHTKSLGSMVYTAINRCRRTYYCYLIIRMRVNMVYMPVSIKPCFQVVCQEVNHFLVLQCKFKIRTSAFSGNGMVENIDCLILIYILQVIGHPTEYFIHAITGGIVTTRHRCNNIMDIAHFKRIKCRSVDFLKKFFPIFPGYQIVVSDGIEYLSFWQSEI